VAILRDRSAFSAINEIRERSRVVAEQAPHILIVRERIVAVAAEFELPPGRGHIGSPLDPELHYLGHGADTVDYLVTLGALRFGSGYHPRLAKQPGLSVGQSLIARLAERFRTRGPFTMEELENASRDSCAALFGQNVNESAQAELMELFARALRDLGRMLAERYGGSTVRFVEAAEGSASAWRRATRRCRISSTSSATAASTSPFFLRGQRVAVDLAQAFDLQGAGAFHDLDLLAPSADNIVPHVLRMDGILRYDRALSERIDRGEAVPAHAEREVEIRAASIHAVELLCAAIARRGSKVTTLQVDSWLRMRGRQPGYRARPRHRARTVLY
jgi:hypothetical protein